MIRMVMYGRLGNNLFQYALGRVLAEKHDTRLVMDGSWYNAESWKQVSQLRRLPIAAKIIRRNSLVWRGFRKLTGKHRWEYMGLPVYREIDGDQRYNAMVFDYSSDCVIFGFYQTPLYFNKISNLLRKELDTSGLKWMDSTVRMERQLCEDSSVAVHIRRQDFVASPVHDVCGMDYYKKAMNEFRGMESAVRFYIFSDDPEWCREQFTGNDEQVVDLVEARADPLVDLHLMKQAQHHIIANSSYSWWAAWLGHKAGQRVICPPRWYNGQVNAPMEEKLCEGWKILADS